MPIANIIPPPPAHLIFRVTGDTDVNWFLDGGRGTIDDFAAALKIVGEKDYQDFRRVLDFGCGSGRLLRWLVDKAPIDRLSGCDIDGPAIDWLRENIPGLDARAINPVPPLDYVDGTFDLVLSYSVFSHFDEAYQNAWLAELSRISMPGAILLLTVHGLKNWDYVRTGSLLKDLPDIDQLDAELRDKGFLYWTGEGWEHHGFPDYYHTAWHLPEYIRANWAKFLDVIDILPGAARPTQDMVVLRKKQ